MRFFKQWAALAALLTTGVVLMLGGTALAAFPDFSDCPASNPAVRGCLDIQNRTGNLNIKGFNVPLGDSLEIRGGITNAEAGGNGFIPPTGTTGLFARPVAVPGGLLGIEWIPGTSVLAITELAGSPSDIRISTATFTVRIPVKVRLVNLLIGMNCHIGNDRNPVVLTLIVGTTSPPPPNRPISGSLGRFTFTPPNLFTVLGNRNVDNTFGVPGATECGLGLGLINSLVNLKLGLPSAAGNNSIEVTNDVAIRRIE